MHKNKSHTTIALFGEAEKGSYNRAYFLQSLNELSHCLGHPPKESFGMYFAVQTLLYNYNVIYFRVQEEGYNQKDYLSGIHTLKKEHLLDSVIALCAPGVGDRQLIEALTQHKHIVITTEPDLYDYLTDIKQSQHL